LQTSEVSSHYTFLNTLLEEISKDRSLITSSHEAIILVSHCVMIMDGFMCKKVGPVLFEAKRSTTDVSNEEPESVEERGWIVLPPQWNKKTEVYNFIYHFNQENEDLGSNTESETSNIVTILFVPLFDQLIINASQKGSSTICRLNIPVQRYFKGEPDGKKIQLQHYVNLPQLISSFRNSISKRVLSPFIFYSLNSLTLRKPVLICDLPEDLTLKTFLFLNPMELVQLSLTNIMLQIASNSASIWKVMCQRAFGLPNTAKERNWKNEYLSRVYAQKITEQQMAKEQEFRRRMRRQYWNQNRLRRPYRPWFGPRLIGFPDFVHEV